MDTSLTIPPSTAVAATATPVTERAITTKVAKIEAGDQSSTLPADKPFVAHVVNARLSGTDFPENPTEIAPPDRTLRPYDVPMLPYSAEAATHSESANAGPDQSEVTEVDGPNIAV
jgi:hypothetical protein